MQKFTNKLYRQKRSRDVSFIIFDFIRRSINEKS